MSIPDIILADQHKIPQIGLGLWQVKDQNEFDQAFTAAIKAGYRHFDCAQEYYNEQMLGNAWQASGKKRSELFLTTKISIRNFQYKKAHSSFEDSLDKLQTDYVDLLLLHFPVTILRKKAWKAVEEIQKAGGARTIGVSNYTIRHLEEMRNYARVMPVVNQVELHVFLQQPELVKYCRDHNIAIEAYSPIAHARAMDNQVINDIAKKHSKTYAQIMLRWCIEQDFVVLPKSVHLNRIQENIKIFDFKLDEQDLAELAKQDRNLRTAWSPVHVP
ncbi:MAG TPA: aldo/keto reductase [Candidatus Dormibacteraeota bacterium]|nr:aldo/keto reductase [Candidatus Dormibacteraeota bacterium]